jgi:hypothetical protein
MRRWIRQELSKGKISTCKLALKFLGLSRAQIFTNVWRKLGYQWVDINTVEKWIQFVQGHRKISPNFDSNEKHYKLLKIVLEEVQNNKFATLKWNDSKIKIIKVRHLTNNSDNFKFLAN